MGRNLAVDAICKNPYMPRRRYIAWVMLTLSPSKTTSKPYLPSGLFGGLIVTAYGHMLLYTNSNRIRDN